MSKSFCYRKFLILNLLINNNHFFQIQAGESQAFINEILQNLNNIICDLSQQQVHVFYEAIGLIICQIEYAAQEQLIKKLMALPNNIWTDTIQQATQVKQYRKFCIHNCFYRSRTFFLMPRFFVIWLTFWKQMLPLVNQLELHFFHKYLCLNSLTANKIKFQLKRIQSDMLNVYQIISGNLSKAVNEHGEQVLRQPLIKTMRVIKREILTLLSTWIARSFEGRVVLQQIFLQ